MKTIQQLITDHIDIWTAAETEKKSGRGRSSGNSESVYGVKKLRELILELAVRGKLVPQNPNDEPADVLLAHIRDKKAGLIAEDKIRNDKPLASLTNENKPFELPNGWAYSRLGDVVEIIRGITFPGSEKTKSPEKGRIACLRTTNVQDQITWDDLLYIREQFVSREGQFLMPQDIVMSMANSKELVGKVALVDNEIHQKTTFGGFLGVLRPFLIEPRFVMTLLRTPHTRNTLIESASQTTNIANISLAKLKPLLFAIPPLAEQHRIVAKVDELMSLCDQLEAQHNNASEAHEKLVDHLLNALSQSQSAYDFNEKWRRITAHFDILFTTESSIDSLKKTLLQLAVMGNLVRQNINDEPADKLMRRLRTQRATWLEENYSNNSECNTMKKKLSKLGNAKPPFPLPNSWVTVHLIDCCQILVDCHNKTAPYTPAGIPIIRTSNIRERKFRMKDMKYVSEDTYQFWSRRCPPEPGDIIFTREAPMGEAAIIPHDEKFCLGQRTMLIRPMHEFILSEYLLIALTEPHLLERSSDSAIGSTVKHLRVGDVEQLNIPLPPLPEQHLIIKKVNELLLLCDQLKNRLVKATKLQLKLADTMANRAALLS